MIFRPVVSFFDRLEDRIRARLSHKSIVYAFVGGVFIVLFWRGVWETADILMHKGGIWQEIFYGPTTIVWTTAVLLLTGLFVSFFIGDRILLSGIKRSKKIEEETEEEIQKEELEISEMKRKVNEIHKDIEEMKSLFRGKFDGDKK